MAREAFLFQAVFFVSEASAIFGQAGIAQGAADSLQFRKQFSQAVAVVRRRRVSSVRAAPAPASAQVNAAQGADCGFQDLGGEFFVFLQQDQCQHAAVALRGRHFQYIGNFGCRR